MKKLVLFLAVFSMLGYAKAQEVNKNDVPPTVMKTFDSLYPKTMVEKWMKKNGNYVAHMSKDMKDLSVLINANGNLIQTEMEIEIASLPNAIPMYIITYYPGLKISKAYSVIDSRGKMAYKVEVGEVNLMFDSMGNFMDSEMKKEMIYSR